MPVLVFGQDCQQEDAFILYFHSLDKKTGTLEHQKQRSHKGPQTSLSAGQCLSRLNQKDKEAHADYETGEGSCPFVAGLMWMFDFFGLIARTST